MERNEQVLSFVAEWFDPHPRLLKRYLLKYFCETDEVEMRDLQTSRKFLKRTKVPPSVSRSDLFMGGHVLLFSRDLKLVDYGDNATRDALGTASERTVLVVAPRLFNLLGEIVGGVEDGGFSLVDLRGFRMRDLKERERTEAARLLGPDASMTNEADGVAVALAFRGVRSVELVHQMMSKPSSGGGGHGIACASSPGEVTAFDAIFFEPPRRTTATFTECTCCVIKPHAIKARRSGAILDAIISRGYEVTALGSFRLSRPAAAEFLEVYDGVAKDYHKMVDELCSGPAIALELRARGDDEDAVTAFRESAGPWDVDMARELYPDSIRARFGENLVQNAVHCTDLPKDGVSEVEYFFDILAAAS